MGSHAGELVTAKSSIPGENNVHGVRQSRDVTEKRQDDVEPELPGKADLPEHPEGRNDDRKHDPKDIHRNLLSLLAYQDLPVILLLTLFAASPALSIRAFSYSPLFSA